jgi:redox-sensitive bicupin YhaK (pirin superfamily)
MKITIQHKDEQAKGQFNGGEILENKPIGFPQDGGAQAPYSNLFYWAHAWTDTGSLIGKHPHQGFEIMSIVLEGDIVHYDSKNDKWFPLKKGDVQIIRAGSGIYHAEQLNKGSHMFQIWYDPDLTKTLSKEPSYDDYSENVFPLAEKHGMKLKTIKGQGSPLEMDTPGIEIYEAWLQPGKHSFALSENAVGSIYLIDGKMKVMEHQLEKDDFAVINDTVSILVEAFENCRLLLITSPTKLDYKPYLEMYRRG